MEDTAQGFSPAETNGDPYASAANAFKVNLGQAAPRDEKGRFAPKAAEEAAQEIETEADATAEAEVESYDEELDEEAAEEAQPEPLDLPTSWPAEQAEAWNSLPPETQAFIREREGQREAAVNAKFQEAANLRKANEVIINEAQANRQRYAEAADMVLSMIQPQRPSPTMLDPRSADYNPDAYHLANARSQQDLETIQTLQQQREQILAQQQQEVQREEALYLSQVEEKYRPALLKDVPELSDPAKQPAVLNELIQYAVSQGIGEHVFSDPEIAGRITSPELHMAWKAMQYDKIKGAQARVKPTAQRPAAPPVRPGVATNRSGVKAAARKRDFDRLATEGSVEAGAAVFKHFLKG